MGIFKIEDVLEKEGIYIATISGISMYPMLRNRRDTVIIKPYKGRLKKFDVPLYRVGDRYVLHRIIKVLPDSYVIRGDNLAEKEYGITDENILGVMTSFYRDEKEIKLNSLAYKTYVFVWHNIFYLRIFVQKVHNKLSRGRKIDAGSDISG